jgi:formate/nitrite transporter FocA (FNT family)
VPTASSSSATRPRAEWLVGRIDEAVVVVTAYRRTQIRNRVTPDISRDSIDTPPEGEEILEAQLREGLSELHRPADGLFLSSLSAGLDIGFGPLLMAVILTTTGLSAAGDLVTRLLLALAYGVGFILVVLGRSELFTEHTTLAVLPVLDGRASVARLGRLWGFVYAGNVVGAAVFAAAVVPVATALGVAEPAAFVELARTFTTHDWPVLLGAGVLAGWLMGLLSWLVAAVDSSVARVLVVWLIAAAIGLAHLPHSVAGAVEVFAGVVAGPSVTPVDAGRFLLFTTLGNAVGGSVFVALLKYGHVVRGGPTVEDVSE